MVGKLTPLGNVIKKAINLSVPHGTIILDIREVWDECVGSTSAKHSLPMYYANNRLTVYVDDSHWQAELKLYEPDIVAKLAQLIPHPIDGIVWKLVHKLPSDPDIRQSKYHPAIHPSHRVSQETSELIEKSVSKLTDKDLQDAMRNFFLKVFSLQESETKNHTKNIHRR